VIPALWLSIGLALATETGTIDGILFDARGVPQPGRVIRIGDVVVMTDALGGFTATVAAGEVEVTVDARDRVGTVTISPGRETEVLLTDVGGGQWFALVETPSLSEDTVTPVDAGPKGPLRGVVRAESGAPLKGARVLVRGREEEAVTDANGVFTLDLPYGTWEVSVVARGFAAQIVRDLNVDATDREPVALSLVPAGLALEDFVVKAPRITGSSASLLEERKTASAVADVVGAEQMRKAGDPDAAQALRRATGITVVGGRYVYVRGLGDRYAATTLNGSTLPSPEPEKRVVPLDLFPTSVLEGVVILKTPSPDQIGEFGGGIVQIRTRGVPSQRVLAVAGTIGARTGTTFQKAQIGPRGPTDFLGIDGGFRAIPAQIVEGAADQPLKPRGIFSDAGYTPEELEAFGESFPNRWDPTTKRLSPDGSLQFTLGNRWKLPGDDRRIGALLSLNWSNSWDADDAFRRVYSTSDSGLQLKRDTTFQSAQNRITLGGMGVIGATLGDGHELVSTTLLNRISTYDALMFTADDPTGSNDTRGVRFAWAEQQLVFQQLRGHHGFLDEQPLTLDWRYAFSQATRLDPDRREGTYVSTEAGYAISQRGTWNELAWGNLKDVNHDAQADVAYAVLRKAARPGLVKAGGMVVQRTRSSNLRRFSYELRGVDGLDLYGTIGGLLTPDNIGATDASDGGYAQIEEVTSNSDDYVAKQALYAGYLMADLPLHARVRWMGGARVEDSTQTVSTFELFNPDNVPVEARLHTTDVLPSTTMTFAVYPGDKPETMLVRLGYGRTLSRPEFRELSTVPFNDFRTGVLYYGNPELQRGLIDHVDVRWEWYPRPGENVSIAGFYKGFRNPIEQVTAVSAVSGLASTFANANRATNLGVEIDFRVTGEGLHEAIRDLYVSGNAAFIRSRIDLGENAGNDTSSERPLQGQSPWVVNASLGYDNPESGVSVSLLYNVFGPRILDVGQSGIPDTYELPVHRLDVVGLIPLPEDLQLRLRATNLLDWPSRQRTGDELAEQRKDGVGFSLGLQWTAPAPKSGKDRPAPR
jgi:TonB-dependent receptor